MMPIVLIIDIARPIEEVFSYITDPLQFPEWQLDVVSARRDDAGSRGVGSRFVTTRRVGRMQRTTTQEIIDVDEPRTWAARTIGGPVSLLAKVTVEPRGDTTRSRVTLSFDFAGRGLGKFLAPLIRRMAAREAPKSLQNLKRRLESGEHRTDRQGSGT